MDEKQFFEYLERQRIKLNPQQRKAVESVTGPTLLLAVPGSGKTTTLIARIGYMVFCKRIAPKSILTLTYTNAATRDMERRYNEIFGTSGTAAVKFRTINSLCNGIIEEHIRMTRARNRLNLMCYKNMRMPFIDVLKKRPQKARGISFNPKPSPNSQIKRSPTPKPTPRPKKPKSVPVTPKTVSIMWNGIKPCGGKPAENFFQPGDRVRHNSGGLGVVVELDGDKVIVDFGTRKRVKLMAEYCVEKSIMKKI